MRVRIADILGLVILGATAIACSSSPTEDSTSTTAAAGAAEKATGAESITFVVDGTPRAVTISGCVQDGGTQTFTLSGSDGLVVELGFFPPALYGTTQPVESLDSDLSWPSGAAVDTLTGSQSQTEDSATGALAGTLVDGKSFTLDFACTVTRT